MIADLDATLADLEEDEGFVPHVYQDHLGFWTLGIGRMVDKRRGGGISRAEADYLLTNDVEGRFAFLMEQYPWFSTLDPVRQSAFLNLSFNLGIEGLAKFRNTMAAAARGDWRAVARGLRDSKWFTQVQPARSGRILRMVKEGHR